MKGKLLLSGILGIMLVFGILVCTACPTANVNTVNIDNDNDNDNTITLSNPPSSVSVTAQSSSSIRISWNEISGATSYNVYRSASQSGSYTLITTTIVTSYTNTGLSPSTTYYYKVSAVNSAGESELSSFSTGATLSSGSVTEATRPVHPIPRVHPVLYG